MFVYNILIMETPIKFNIDNNSYYSNKKEIEQVNELLAKKTKEFNESFFKEHCIPNSLLKEKGKLILIPNPDLDNSWLERFKNNWKELEHTPLSFGTAGNHNEHFTVFVPIANAEKLEKQVNDTFKKVYPLTPNECFEKEVELNNKKHILVIGLPSNFFNIIKILKTNKNQYFVLYKSKWSLKEKTFDTIVVDSSMPYHLEFYNSIKKYIKYKVPTYLLEKETLKILK